MGRLTDEQVRETGLAWFAEDESLATFLDVDSLLATVTAVDVALDEAFTDSIVASLAPALPPVFLASATPKQVEHAVFALLRTRRAIDAAAAA